MIYHLDINALYDSDIMNAREKYFESACNHLRDQLINHVAKTNHTKINHINNILFLRNQCNERLVKACGKPTCV